MSGLAKPVTARIQDLDETDLVVISRAPADPGEYEIMPDTGVSEIRRRRDVVTSPYVHGEVEVSSVREARRFQLNVRCVGSDWADACTLRDALYTACQQRRGYLRHAIDGVLEVYEVRAADFTSLPRNELMITNKIEVQMTFPVARRIT